MLVKLDLKEVEFIFVAVSILVLLLVVGLWLRHRSRTLTRLFLPGSVVAGVLALLLGADVLGSVSTLLLGKDTSVGDGLFGNEITSIWRALPSLLINVVFAALFLGKSIPAPRQIWHLAGPVVCYGQTIAWGQYVIGLALAVLILTPVFGINPMAGALIEISFEGGHGTAAGLAPSFEALGFPEGVDLALGLASVGLLSAIISGIILIKWADRRGYLAPDNTALETNAIPEDSSAILKKEDQQSKKTVSDMPIDPMSFHLGLIAVSILIGAGLLELLVQFERLTWGALGLDLFVHVPLFPMAMIGGSVVQILSERYGLSPLINRSLVNHIAGVSLDLIIVAALATLSLAVIADNIIPFILLAATGIFWNVAGFLLLAPRFIPNAWFEKGIPNFGQSMGMTVTGIMLFQMADPKNRTGGLESFGYKQLMFEPIVGGGIFTASALPLIYELGPWPVMGITSIFFCVWLFVGLRIRGKDTGKKFAPASEMDSDV